MAKPIGGRLASRPLHFFLLLDVSGSMSVDDKIGSLNRSIQAAIPHLRSEVKENPGIELLLQAVTFAHDAEWHVEQPTPIDGFQWTDVEAVSKGTTEVGRAIHLVTERLKELEAGGRGLPPVLVLVSDGKPTDFKQPSFGASLRALEETAWGKKASRIAIGIGEDADDESLRRFIGHDEIEPLRADNPEDLLRYVRWASTVVVGDAAKGAGTAMAPPAIDEPLEVPLPEDLAAWEARQEQERAAAIDPPAPVPSPPTPEPVDIDLREDQTITEVSSEPEKSEDDFANLMRRPRKQPDGNAGSGPLPEPTPPAPSRDALPEPVGLPEPLAPLEPGRLSTSSSDALPQPVSDRQPASAPRPDGPPKGGAAPSPADDPDLWD